MSSTPWQLFKITKNQKIHLQVANSVSTPLKTGPKLGAVLVLRCCQQGCLLNNIKTRLEPFARHQ
jgi:hypothetical protein